VSADDGRVRVAYFVPPSPHFAGIERVVHEIATGLMEAHGDLLNVHVLYASRYDDDVLDNTRYTLHVLDVDRLRYVAGKVRACVAANSFDILICAQVEASVLVWVATRGLRLPVFITHLHGNPRVEEMEGTPRARVAFTLFRHVVSRRIAGILAVSPSLRDYAARSLTRHAEVHFAKNPLRALDAAEERRPRDDGFRFLTVARMSRQKGLDILLRALAAARADLPPVTLTLVGSGPDEAALKRLSAELGLDDLVIFAGYTSDPAEYFRSADCFVLPSRWEGFPLVLLEALRFGLPLLAANCDFGPSDLIADPRVGELVDAENLDALAEGLKRAARRTSTPDDEDLRRRIARDYERAATSRMHFAVIKHIVASGPRRAGRLATFVGS
jgi:glycosyltransferase involved in cell wall biosynthesis